jgi:hypothetical protein
LFIIFLVIEGMYAKEPIMPLYMLSHRTPLAAAFVCFPPEGSNYEVKLVHFYGIIYSDIHCSVILPGGFKSLLSRRWSATDSRLNWDIRWFSHFRINNGKDGMSNI